MESLLLMCDIIYNGATIPLSDISVLGFLLLVGLGLTLFGCSVVTSSALVSVHVYDRALVDPSSTQSQCVTDMKVARPIISYGTLDKGIEYGKGGRGHEAPCSIPACPTNTFLRFLFACVLNGLLSVSPTGCI